MFKCSVASGKGGGQGDWTLTGHIFFKEWTYHGGPPPMSFHVINGFQNTCTDTCTRSKIKNELFIKSVHVFKDNSEN